MTENAFNRTDVLLCPHTFLPGPLVKTFYLFLESFTVFCPWFSDPQASWLKGLDFPGLTLRFPPENLKPDPSFAKTLKEINAWIKKDFEPGSRAFLKPGPQTGSSEETSRLILHQLRDMNQPARPTAPTRTIPWHVMLHLAQALEEQQAAADTILRALRAQDSPLQELIEIQAEEPGLLQDLPQIQSTALLIETQWEQVLLTWCGLFDSYLSDYPVLITLQRPFLDLLAGIWDQPDLVTPLPMPESAELLLPDLQAFSSADLIAWKKNYAAPSDFAAFKNTLFAIDITPEERRQELQQISQKILAAFPNARPGKWRMTRKPLGPLPDARPYKNTGLLTGLLNKTIILFEEIAD